MQTGSGDPTQAHEPGPRATRPQARAPRTRPFGAEAFAASEDTRLGWLGMAGFLRRHLAMPAPDALLFDLDSEWHVGLDGAVLPALVAGGRYVRNESVVRRMLARLAAFVVPACAVWALLPLIASQQLGLSASGYGLLFAALGAGAVFAALSLGRVKAQPSSNAIVGWSAVCFGAAFTGLAAVHTLGLAAALLVLCGYAWTATVSSVVSELQPRRLARAQSQGQGHRPARGWAARRRQRGSGGTPPTR